MCVTDFVVHWEPRRFIDELGTVDMTAFANGLLELYAGNLVIDRAGDSLDQRGFYDFLDSAEHVAADRQARAVARQLARPRRRGAKIEDGFLKEVVERVRTSSTKETWAYYDVDERTLRRWLSEAYDRGYSPGHRRARAGD